jgi:hypothetical protein
VQPQDMRHIHRYCYAEFICSDCGEEWADELPPLWEELPTCPTCGAAGQIKEPLTDRRAFAG